MKEKPHRTTVEGHAAPLAPVLYLPLPSGRSLLHTSSSVHVKAKFTVDSTFLPFPVISASLTLPKLPYQEAVCLRLSLSCAHCIQLSISSTSQHSIPAPCHCNRHRSVSTAAPATHASCCGQKYASKTQDHAVSSCLKSPQ